MRTSLRAAGAYKKDFLFALVRRYDTRAFSFKQIRKMRSFEHKTFYRLYADGYLKVDKDRKGYWKVVGAEVLKERYGAEIMGVE